MMLRLRVADRGMTGSARELPLAGRCGGATLATMSDARKDIRGAGLRATASRMAVLDYVRDAAQPVSHADLVDALGTDKWDRTTLYRNLVDLAEVGLLHKTELGDRVWRYEHRASSGAPHQHAHPHFVCTSCGDVQCLEGVTVSSQQQAVPRVVGLGEVEIHLRGVCDDCR